MKLRNSVKRLWAIAFLITSLIGSINAADLKILYAVFGDMNQAGMTKKVDITGALSSRISNNKLTFSKGYVPAQLGIGDPAFGVHKGIIIFWQDGTKIYFTLLNDIEAFSLPNTSSTLIYDTASPSNAAFKVLKAWYGDLNYKDLGTGGSKRQIVEVTNKVEGMVAGSQLNLPANVRADSDPAFGIVKGLIVVFASNGELYFQIVAENQAAKITAANATKFYPTTALSAGSIVAIKSVEKDKYLVLDGNVLKATGTSSSDPKAQFKVLRSGDWIGLQTELLGDGNGRFNLGTNPDSKATNFVTTNFDNWEQWSLESEGAIQYLKSRSSGGYLSVRANGNVTTFMEDGKPTPRAPWERLQIEFVSPTAAKSKPAEAEVQGPDASNALTSRAEGGKYSWRSSWKFPTAGKATVTFTANAKNDIHIALATAPDTANAKIEIVGGGWGNTKSVVRNGAQSQVLLADFPGVKIANPGQAATYTLIVDSDAKTIKLLGLSGEISYVAKDSVKLDQLQYISFSSWDTPIIYSDIEIAGVSAQKAADTQQKPSEVTVVAAVEVFAPINELATVVVPEGFEQEAGLATSIGVGSFEKELLIVKFDGKLKRYVADSMSEQPWDTIATKDAAGKEIKGIGSVSVSSDGVIGINNADGDVFVYDRAKRFFNKLAKGDGNEAVIIQQFSFGKKEVLWGIDQTGTIYQYDFEAKSWMDRSPENTAVAISAGIDGSVYAVNTANKVFQHNGLDANTGLAKWKSIPDLKLSTVSVASKDMAWGIYNGQLMQMTGGKWAPVNSKDGKASAGLALVSGNAAGTLALIDANNKVYVKGDAGVDITEKVITIDTTDLAGFTAGAEATEGIVDTTVVVKDEPVVVVTDKDGAEAAVVVTTKPVEPKAGKKTRRALRKEGKLPEKAPAPATVQAERTALIQEQAVQDETKAAVVKKAGKAGKKPVKAAKKAANKASAKVANKSANKAGNKAAGKAAKKAAKASAQAEALTTE